VTIAGLLRDIADPPGGGSGGYLLVTPDGGLEYHPHDPGATLTEQQRALVREHKDRIVAFLSKAESELEGHELEGLDYRQTLPTDELDAIFAEWEPRGRR